MSIPGLTVSPGLMSRRSAGGNDSFTKLLLHFDGVDGQTTTVDSASPAKAITVVSPAILSSTQTKFGGTSLRPGLTGSGTGKVTTPNHTDFSFGNSTTGVDFTLDCWIYFTSAPSPYLLLFGDNSGYEWGVNMSGNGINLWTPGNYHQFGWPGSPTPTPPLNTWCHMATQRKGAVFASWVNGLPCPTTFNEPSTAVNLSGVMNIGGLSSVNHIGYLDEFRVSRGIARYPYVTSITVPTAEFTTDANTKLLLHLNGANNDTTTTDSSGTSKAISFTGGGASGLRLSTTSPKFGSTSLFFPAVGTTYISTPYHADFDFGAASGNTNDFTVEFFVNFSNLTSSPIGLLGGNSTSGWALYYSAGTLIFYAGGANSFSWPGGSPTLNQWYHIAFNRYGNLLFCFIDGAQIGSPVSLTGAVNAYASGTFKIGSYDGFTASYNLNGYIDELRISKGVARYPAGQLPFTPNSAPYG